MAEPMARTVKDFCRAYGVGKTLTYELMAAGTLTALKAGSRTLITEASAKAWLASLPRTHVFVGTNVGTHEQNTDTHEKRRTQANKSKAITTAHLKI